MALDLRTKVKLSTAETLSQGGQGRSCFVIQMMRSSEGRVFRAENSPQNTSKAEIKLGLYGAEKRLVGRSWEEDIHVCADTSDSEGLSSFRWCSAAEGCEC